jgi:LacI family transcriptional regulator, galactose operon repressor
MATIKDVAKRAGVGLGTASRVIAGNGPVSAGAIRRVRKAVAELKFRPSHAARSLQRGQSQTIGVFVPLITGSFYTPILHAIYTALRASGRQMVVDFGQSLASERQDALEGARFLADRGCDGLIMMGTALKPADIDCIAERQPRFVVLNRSIPGFRERCFNPDHRAAGAAAARALLAAGHRRLAFIEGPATSRDNTLRMRGFRETLRRCGIDAERLPHTRGDFSPESGRAGAQELLGRGTPFTALFCANDEMAIGAISCLGEAGVAVPRQCSVMGYDGIDLSALTVPPLTTVLIPWRELATNALHHLLNLCYGSALPVRRDIPAQVLWRASVARI